MAGCAARAASFGDVLRRRKLMAAASWLGRITRGPVAGTWPDVETVVRRAGVPGVSVCDLVTRVTSRCILSGASLGRSRASSKTSSSVVAYEGSVVTGRTGPVVLMPSLVVMVASDDRRGSPGRSAVGLGWAGGVARHPVMPKSVYDACW